MLRRLLLTVLLAIAPAAAFAQTTPANPRLTANARGVQSDETVRELKLRRFDVEVSVRGVLAEAVITAAFDNPGEESLEGDFSLTLPEGAIVTGYALDIGDTMVDGVLVDQPRAKAVYEDRVRAGVDPALAEVSSAGVFRTRVFPILPGKGRTIRVRLIAPLFTALGSDEIFRLPLGLAAPREGWSITVRASAEVGAPLLDWPGRASGPMGRVGEDWVSRSEGKGALSGALTIGRQPFAALLNVAPDGARTMQLTGTLPDAGAAKSGSVRVYWDRSRARREARHEDELALLRRTLVALGARSIEVVTFNSSGAERRTVSDAGAAIALLSKVRYEGATSYAALTKEQAAVDRCLLFAGIRPTIDREAALTARCRLDAVTTLARADMGWLRLLARRHGGGAYALGKDPSVVEKALGTQALSVAGVYDAAGAPLAFVPVESRAGHWTLVAQAPEAGPVTVRIGTGEQSFTLPGDSFHSGADGVLLAVDRLAALDPVTQRADFVALSRKYGIAGPDLAYLVLERPDDYIRADIAPPASYPEALMADWRELRADADGEAAEDREGRLGKVVKAWQDQVKWWETKFDPRARPKRERESREPQPVYAPMPTPMPTPTPTPAPVQSVDGITAEDVGSLPDDGAQNIVVTGSRVDSSGAKVEIDAWQPSRPYLTALDAAPKDYDRVFAEQEGFNGTLPAFYFDVAEWLRKHDRMADARETLLSALDLPVADAGTVAIVASRLERYGDIDRAIALRERAVALEPDRPQPKRFLALALAKRAAMKLTGAKADLTRAIRLLGEVATSVFDDDWDGIDLIALMEANALIPKLRALGGDTDLDPRLIKLLDVDVRVVVDWNTNATDLDLWVDEPNGERAIYNNPRTAIGGHLSNDMTAGYGPEEYLLRRAPAGTYKIQANVFASDRIDPNGPSVITARLIRDFGRPTEREEVVDIEVIRFERGGDNENGARMIGRIVVPKRR